MTYTLCPEELCVRVCAESILDMSDCIRKYIYTRHYDACSSHKLLPFLQVGIGSELEKAMTTHSGTLAWKILSTEEPGRLQSMESLGVRHD